MMEYSITFFGNRPSFKNFVVLVDILIWESMGKPKTWNISKTDDRRAKRTKIWDLGYYIAYKKM